MVRCKSFYNLNTYSLFSCLEVQKRIICICLSKMFEYVSHLSMKSDHIKKRNMQIEIKHYYKVKVLKKFSFQHGIKT